MDAALQLAVRVRQWPAEQAATALLALAGDPDTRSPMRLAKADPWWDGAAPAGLPTALPSTQEVKAAESELKDAGGRPVQRATVAIRALELLQARASDTAADLPA